MSVLPAKTDTVLVVDPDTILSRSLALQCLQPVRWERRQIAKCIGTVNLYQPPERGRRDTLERRDPLLPKMP
jgi:hypothetical protein